MQELQRHQPASLLLACRWSLRDFIAAAGLFFATAAVVLWQNAHLVILWDLSYTLDSSMRIALGQMPYRDFPFVHTPLTFLIQAAIIRLTGRVFFHHVLYATIMGGLGTVLTWRIALNTLRGRLEGWWIVSLLLTAPLTLLGIYCILSHPSYDCDCIFFVLVAVLLLQRVEADSVIASTQNQANLVRSFAAGAAVTLPLFFKQNIGLPFLAVALASILLLLVAKFMVPNSSVSPGAPALLAVLGGAIATLLAGALLIQFTAGLGNCIHWIIQFAAQRRMPGFKDMVGIYLQPSFVWMLPCVAAALLLLRAPFIKNKWAQALALVLLAAPFLWTLLALFFYDDADERGDNLLALWPLLLVLSAILTLFNLRRGLNLRALLPVMVLAAINGTFLSQQLWGSTYAIWPLLILLIAEMIVFLATLNLPRLAQAMAGVIAITLLVCGGLYTASEERLSYTRLPEGKFCTRHSRSSRGCPHLAITCQTLKSCCASPPLTSPCPTA